MNFMRNGYGAANIIVVVCVYAGTDIVRQCLDGANGSIGLARAVKQNLAMKEWKMRALHVLAHCHIFT